MSLCILEGRQLTNTDLSNCLRYTYTVIYYLIHQLYGFDAPYCYKFELIVAREFLLASGTLTPRSGIVILAVAYLSTRAVLMPVGFGY